jgi:hypothetical protein
MMMMRTWQIPEREVVERVIRAMAMTVTTASAKVQID